MFFFNKPSTKELVFMTAEEPVLEFASPRPLSKNSPEWWKNTAAYYEGGEGPTSSPSSLPPGLKPKKLKKTVKHCYAIQEIFKRGIELPLWRDYFVMVDQNGKAYPITPGNKPHSGDQHPEVQYPNLLAEDWVNFKFVSPWVAYTKKPIHFYMNHPFYHWKNAQFQTMPGVLEFYHQHTTNINTILRRPISQEGIPMAIEHEFACGDTMAYLMPMSEDKIKIRTELVSQSEMEKARRGHQVFFSAARKFRKENIGGCPFHPKGIKK
jgi:hypothetical protein